MEARRWQENIVKLPKVFLKSTKDHLSSKTEGELETFSDGKKTERIYC